MTDGKLPGRADRRPPRRVGAAVMRGSFGATLWVLFLLATSTPAEAQRPGRRWRSAPPAPRAQSTPRPAPQPSTPAGARAAPQSGNQQAGTRTSPKAPAAGGKEGEAERKTSPSAAKAPANGVPQTAATAEAPPSPRAPAASDEFAWDGPAPFSEDWRVDHPAAWRPEEGAGDVVLAGGARVPTRVDTGAVDVAQWTPRDRRSEAAAPQSVLQASAEVALPDAAIPASDLVVFPGADGALPAAAIAAPSPSAATAAADGTVSVLVREEAEAASIAEPTAGAPATVSLSQEESSSPWLPLGAFAAVPAGSDSSLAPHVFLELALHRDGTVRGNYFDAVSDAVHPVTGRFDRERGSLSWRIGSGGAEFETTAEGLAGGRGEATVRRGTTERSWLLIALP